MFLLIVEIGAERRNDIILRSRRFGSDLKTSFSSNILRKGSRDIVFIVGSLIEIKSKYLKRKNDKPKRTHLRFQGRLTWVGSALHCPQLVRNIKSAHKNLHQLVWF